MLADGHVVVGTGPSGQVVDLTDPEHPAAAPDRAVQYIWDLATDTKGNLFAATGPSGQLWKRSADGKWSLLLDTRHAHLLCVAVGPDGAVYAGSDGEGLIYRVAPDGKASVVYDAPQSEIRTLRFGPDRALYAGTAAEAGGGGGSGRGSAGFLERRSGRVRRLRHRPDRRGGRPVRRGPEEGRSHARAGPRRPATPSGGSALPRPVTAGDNSVYRIDADGVPREIFRVKALIYALAWQGDRLIVGTGPEGQLYEVRNLGQESAPIARLDNGQVLALLEEPAGNLLVGTGDPGAVVRLMPGHMERGTLRLRRPRHQAHQPLRRPVVAGRAARGDVGRAAGPHRQRRRARRAPGRTGRANRPTRRMPLTVVPPGRFVQYRATLTTRNPAVTPELRSVALCYQSANLPPEINKIDVPDISAGDGATRQTRLTLRWDVIRPQRRRPELHRAGPQGGLARLGSPRHQPPDRDELRLGHDRRAGGALPRPPDRERPPLEQPRRRPDPRAHQRAVPDRSREPRRDDRPAEPWGASSRSRTT